MDATDSACIPLIIIHRANDMRYAEARSSEHTAMKGKKFAIAGCLFRKSCKHIHGLNRGCMATSTSRMLEGVGTH